MLLQDVRALERYISPAAYPAWEDIFSMAVRISRFTVNHRLHTLSGIQGGTTKASANISPRITATLSLNGHS